MAHHDITAHGAKPDGESSSTRAIQSAIDACAANGGGTVVIPAGRFVTGTLWMRSNVELHLESGATLLGSHDVNEFPEWVSRWEGPGAKPRRAALICGEGLENVSLTGRGTINARGDFWWKLQTERRGKEVLRPLLYRLVDSRNLLVRDVTFRNSPMWTISPLACDNVVIDGITILNPPDSPNTDGINPDSCSNVRIANCHVDVGDDCVTIKSGKEDDGRQSLRPCQNITITNCTLVHGHGGVVVGSEMSGSVRNVVISNCVFQGTDRGLRFKARRGRGGVVEDVRADNLVMDGVHCPIVVNLFYGCGAWGEDKVTNKNPLPVDAGTPRFRRFRFSNITAKDAKFAAAYLLGLPEMSVEDVALDNVTIRMDDNNTEAGEAAMAPGIEMLCRAGVVAKHVRGLRLNNVDLAGHLGEPYSLTSVDHLQMTGCRPAPERT